MIVAILITLLAVVGVLLLLANVAASEAYLGRPPSGPDAMGLAALFFATIGGTLALLLACWVATLNHSLTWLGSRPFAFVIGSLATLGIGLACGAALIAWSEKRRTWLPPVGIVVGALAPIGLGLLIIVSAWSTVEPGKMRMASIPVSVVALLGLGAGVYGLLLWSKASADRTRRELQRIGEQQAEDQ